MTHYKTKFFTFLDWVTKQGETACRQEPYTPLQLLHRPVRAMKLTFTG